MSKISPLIASYLREHKTLNLEGYGKFYVDNNTAYVDPSEKNAVPSPILFDYNPSAATDEEFIQYIIKETGKIRPLAIADLDTFLLLGKQLLNISKPLVIEGVGTLNKATAGNYQFIGGLFEPPKISTDNDRDRRIREAKEPQREKAISFENNYQKEGKNNSGLLKKILGALTLLLIVGGAGFAVYKFLIDKGDSTPTTKKENNVVVAKKDTSITDNKPKDTTVLVNKPVTPPDSLGRVNFKLVVRTTDSIGAYKRAAQLKSADYNGGKLDAVVEKDNANNTYKVILNLLSNPVDTGALRAKMQTNYGTSGQSAFYQ